MYPLLYWLDDALCSLLLGGNVIVPLPLDFHRDLLANYLKLSYEAAAAVGIGRAKVFGTSPMDLASVKPRFSPID